VLTLFDARGLQFHLAELEKPDVLNGMLPGLGRDWTEITPSLSTAFLSFAVYALEWEAVAASWTRDEHALLQPATPSWAQPAAYSMLMKGKIAKKELELCALPTAL
jgi:hypothetical protein